ncbi:single-stranded DNA-binding protein [Bacillus infantis]|uniref:single-stranded DNA-binding protein n=1 Tax=Bacillus infantis TaxID=324767 RepID=UPI003CE8A3EE
MKIDSNQVRILGRIVSTFEYNHSVMDEEFFLVFVETQRASGTNDRIQVLVSSKLFDITKDYTNEFIYIEGQFRSYNMDDGQKKHLFLSVFATEIYIVDEAESINEIILDGFICKKPSFRETPLGREITDLILAVNRPYGRSDYIPCICWGRNARYSASFGVGEHISLTGRIQSREYIKDYGDHSEALTAYEVSVSKISTIE